MRFAIVLMVVLCAVFMQMIAAEVAKEGDLIEFQTFNRQ